ncbi:hypothetical protein [Lysobacter solisilvae (ex Woo and Kim 2020)]|uniref:Uncharacterized protein n=1 Tax=Agrilutibacter terrestris TaxID=2865112 RepID=A0A7H0G0I1_9GAMM|nr:hypothetical protein [Lysobacter terrestris]QNP41797.1 hypothetical protein H8B22_06215 [Lysobacter terrestris]
MLAGQATTAQAPAEQASAALPSTATAAPAAVAPAPAAPAPAANTATTVESTQDKDDRLVCRREQRTGSLMVQRACRTVGERRRERDQARDQVRSNGSLSPQSDVR